jgi:hypothetical protein
VYKIGGTNGENHLINYLVPNVNFICARCDAETHWPITHKVMGGHLNSRSFAGYSGHLIPAPEASSMIIGFLV